MSEFVKASKLVEEFLGISWGHLCPQFGFNHNSQHLLFMECVISFVLFHCLLTTARWLSRQFQQEDKAKREAEKDASMMELEKFSTMIDSTLNTMTQQEANSTSASRQPLADSTNTSFRTTERPKDLEDLREEFQRRIAAVKTKWEAPPEEVKKEKLLPAAPDETDEFHLTAAIGVLYWAIQAILSCVVMCSIGLSMLNITLGGVWPHYCLLIYAVSNSGILPTASLGLSFVVDWFVFEGITTLPVHDLGKEDPLHHSYSPMAAEEGMMVAQKRKSPEEMQKHQEEVDQIKPKFILLCLPQLVPMAFMVLTHTIPFFFMFLWLSIVLAGLAWGILFLVREAVKQFVSTPRARILRQTQVLAFLVYMFTAMYIHTSVQVMTRVYAGEWRHGGFFDSLWWHLIIDTDKLAACPWFNPIRLVDFPLRWT